MSRPDATPIRRRLELGRLVVGGLLVLVVKAYGAGAAVAVLLSDAETLGGKVDAAVAAVPTLVEEYQRAEYVVENRDEIRDAVDYLDQETPRQEELQRTLDESRETLTDVTTTFDALDRARDAGIGSPFDAADAARDAWESKPSLDALRELEDTAEQLGPVADQVGILLPVYYGGVATVNDNLASDELASTLTVMAAALALAFVVAQGLGFWVRRGRPGVLARALQRLGARTFRSWYVRHAPYALGDPVYAAARERVHRDLLAGAGTLGPEARRELEAYVAGRPPAG
ncbi:hypothetical protein [Nocardioides perillae]|uniref:Uncharacterized protein n=1 Tax=Nocardioides perillae TaxID=1119534 RepID=A0A7Y9RTK0_9ACTN|nr:hypothetical protein [Nocardioides perillae]NYG55036.1 hypothetical protein [Nocardioides perillae]